MHGPVSCLLVRSMAEGPPMKGPAHGLLSLIDLACTGWTDTSPGNTDGLHGTRDAGFQAACLPGTSETHASFRLRLA
jgi:hypothetical protein